MHSIFPDKLLPAVCWALVHSLWQGLVLSVLAGVVMLLTRRSAAALRYFILCTLFFLFLGGVVASFLLEWNAVHGTYGMVPHPTSIDPNINEGLLTRWIESLSVFLDINTNWIVLIWFIVLVLKSGKVVLDVYHLHLIRTRNILPTSSEWVSRVQELAGQIGIRKQVCLVESALLKVPIIIGHFKPLILVPAGLLTHLPPEELEAILLHELAHIRRQDYLVNFIQRLAETVFFFNPGLLWLSSLLRVERENCCDDLAIAQTSDKLQFVEALIRCKELSLQAPAHALGLFGKKNLLLQRVTRLVSNRNKALSTFELAFFILNLLAVIVIFSSMRNADRPPVQREPDVISIQKDSKAGSIDRAHKLQRPAAPQATERLEKFPRKELTSVTNHTSAHIPIQKNAASITVKAIQKSVEAQVGSHDLVLKESDGQNKMNSESLEKEDAVNAIKRLTLIDRELVERNREQARKDREQAERDREQATKDREAAEKDRQQAEKDREQARKDREQANRERKNLIYQQLMILVKSDKT